MIGQEEVNSPASIPSSNVVQTESLASYEEEAQDKVEGSLDVLTPKGTKVILNKKLHQLKPGYYEEY